MTKRDRKVLQSLCARLSAELSNQQTMTTIISRGEAKAIVTAIRALEATDDRA
jgi:hypothetical protein